ncbi:MAG: hypothetical protein ACTTKL_02580 [Treponema sp.]
MNKANGMKKNMFSTLGVYASAAAKIAALALVCTFSAFVIVFPLWKFAVAAPKIYSAVILILCAAALAYIFVKKARSTPLKTTFRRILIALAIAAGLAASYVLLLNGMRLFALLAFAAAALLCALVSNLLQDNEQKNLR